MIRPGGVPPGHSRSLGPLRPNFFMPRPLLPNGRDQGFPQGYTANVTAINAGIGPPIPAIVLKKKRKKRRKNKSKSLVFPDEFTVHSDTASPKPDLDDGASSNSGSALLTNQRRSEPDLTKLGHCQLNTDKPGFPRKKDVGLNYPNDLDLIQSALENGPVSMANSCPDLSEAQRELLEDFWNMGEEENNPTSSSSLQKISESPTKQTGPKLDDYELSSPQVSSAIHTALDSSEGKITSPAVKELDKGSFEIMAEMALNGPLDSCNGFEEEDDDDDQIFARLLKTQEHERNFINSAAPGKSIFDEIEEKQLLFPERAPVHFAVTHGKNGTNSLLLSDNKKNSDKWNDKNLECLFPHLPASDDEAYNDNMHITVNKFEDPEELVLDDLEIEPRNNTKFSQIKESLRGLKRSKSLDFPFHPPKSDICSCSVM